MFNPSSLFRLASIIFVIMGFCHVLMEIYSHLFSDANLKNPFVVTVMKGFTISIFGTKRTYFTYMTGFSLAMGIFISFFGVANYLLSNAVFLLKKASLVNSVFTLFIAVFSAFFFNLAPVIVYSITALIYTYVHLRLH
ncbi:MAG: LIC_13387 family protein [Cytophagaceae bacterium]